MNEHARCDQSLDDDDIKQQRITQTIETWIIPLQSRGLNQQHDKIDQFFKYNTPRIGSGKTKREVKSNITDNESAKMTTSTCALIPDNKFRSRDPKFIKQKDKYGKRKSNAKPSTNATIPAKDFHLNVAQKNCRCPAGKLTWLKNNRQDTYGNDKLFFEGRLTDCRECHIKHLCMKNPLSAETRNGHGRQVSFIIKKNKRAQRYTDCTKFSQSLKFLEKRM